MKRYRELSLDSQASEKSLASLRAECEAVNGLTAPPSDPLEILIQEEEEFDVEFALDVLRHRHLHAGRCV